jgi:diguanylate cyclase (GGDEF)-like protein
MPFELPPASQEQSPELPRAIARLAFVGGAVITLLLPMAFLVVSYQSEVARLEAALNTGTPGISNRLQSIARDHAHVPSDVAASLAWLGSETRVRIIGDDPSQSIEVNRSPSPPLLVRTAVLDMGGQSAWRLELSRSMRPQLLFALLLFAPGLLLGGLAYIALKDVPMRAFHFALKEIAERKSAEERLAKSLSIFSATLESTADGILVTDVSGRAVVANQRFIDLWRLPRSICTAGFDSEMLTALTDQLRDSASFVSTQKDLTKHIDIDHGAVLQLRDGRLFEWNSRPQYIDGIVVGRVSSFRDISQRKRAEVLLTAEKEVLEMVVCGAPLKAALSVLARHVEVLSGQMFCVILFREGGEESRPTCSTGPSLPDALFEGMIVDGGAAVEAIFVAENERQHSRQHGSDEHSEVIGDVATDPAWAQYRGMMSRLDISPCFAVSVLSSTGSLLGLIVAHYRQPSDHTPHDRELIWVAAHLTSIAIERRQAEARLRLLAHYDALTLLPNRDLFRDRLSHALSQAQRHGGMVAVMFLDLDRFKTVNDTLGHDAGDLLLTEVSDRLRRCVRQEDTVARLGGDEFTVIIEQIGRPGDAAVVARKIVDALAPPVNLNGHEAFVTPSIGITIYPSDSDNAEDLLRNADTAMYRVKEEGGNGYLFFTPEMNTLAAGRLDMESGLRRALEREEFIVYYQPKLDLATGTIIGAEALLRWNHPDKGLVSPGQFIPILEETGMIEPVGLWVLNTVCAQMRSWQDAGMPPLTVAVNLSGRQLQRANLSSVIAGILKEAGLAPEFLELEVTESMLMHDPKYAAEMLAEIRAKGVVHIGVDDFGTGYSSLSYLKRFPIDALKLDKSFVDGLPHDEDDIAIARAVIALAHSLKLIVVAEGVETEDQRTFLHENGCDVLQGYLISRPLPAASFARLIWDRTHMGPGVADGFRPGRALEAEETSF